MYINISSEVLRCGMRIGIELSRLDWLWGNEYEVAQKSFALCKDKVLRLLSVDNIKIDETDFVSFYNSIMDHYLRTDIAMYSSILIGLTIHRCTVAGVSKNDNTNSEIKELAKSSLSPIPQKIVSDKEYLFNEIFKRKDEGLAEITEFIESLSNENDTLSVKSVYAEYDVFISHANKDKEDLVEELYQSLKKLDINIFYDKESFEWGDNWKEKILNGTQKAKFAIIVISDNFFGREWTERELSEFLNKQNRNGQKLILPILHNITVSQLYEKYPTVADLQAIESSKYTCDQIAIMFARQLIKRLKKSESEALSD